MSWNINTENKEREAGNKNPAEVHKKAIKQIGNDEIDNLFFPLTKPWNKDIYLFLQEVVHYIHKLLKKERFENDYIEKNFGKLSARELLTEGKTFYMNPCLDFVLVTIEGLKRTGIENIQFIVEELECPWDGFKLHFGIEVSREGKNYYIDYRWQNNVFLGEWNFISKYKEKGESVIHNIKVDAKNISVDDNIYTLIDKGIVNFKKFDPKFLEVIKERLKKHNGPEQRTRWFVKVVKDIHQPEIFIEDSENTIS